ncbi:MAG: pantothenate synthetase [Acidimicrobiia bacterium]|nr:pantothenate synthetase [Acidimicrobiia bacterium]
MPHSKIMSTGSAASSGAASTGAVAGLGADRDALVEVLSALPAEGWAAPSGCAGWSVKDLVAHMGALFWTLVDRSVLPDTTGLPTERAQDAHVAARASWEPARTFEDYVTVSGPALEVLTRLDARPDRVLALGDLGTYPAPLLGTAFAFDHYTHIRADLFAPRGPLAGPVPPADELRLRPVMAWMRAALPQHSASVLAALGGAVELALHGPAGGTWYVGPDGVRDERPTGGVVASVRSSTHDFVLWGTERARWEDLDVVAEGDASALAALRRVHVF